MKGSTVLVDAKSGLAQVRPKVGDPSLITSWAICDNACSCNSWLIDHEVPLILEELLSYHAMSPCLDRFDFHRR